MPGAAASLGLQLHLHLHLHLHTCTLHIALHIAYQKNRLLSVSSRTVKKPAYDGNDPIPSTRLALRATAGGRRER